MKVALVVIGRLENRYAVEYVEYYKHIGFDHIFICDNNYDGEEYFEDVLQSYIDDQFVTICDYRNIRNKEDDSWNKSIQVISYIDTYNKIKNDYDWVAFFDFDEYLTLSRDKDVKVYLSRKCFENINQILINWKIYTDNDLIYDDGRPCLERFTKPMQIGKCIEYDYPENKHVKAIIRGGLSDLVMYTPHNFYNDVLKLTTSNNNGECRHIKIVAGLKELDYTFAYIKHFVTKTIDEYIVNKQKRGTADRNKTDFNTTYPILRFFKYNRVTPEKLNYLKEHGFDISNITKENIEKWKIDFDQYLVYKINLESVLITIGQFDNNIIKFIEYYKNLGINFIYFISIGKKLEITNELQSYINNKFIEIKNYSCNIEYQNNSYEDLYDEISHVYDWIFFCDYNKYLVLEKDKTINEYLSRKIFYNEHYVNIIDINMNKKIINNYIQNNISDNTIKNFKNSFVKGFVLQKEFKGIPHKCKGYHVKFNN